MKRALRLFFALLLTLCLALPANALTVEQALDLLDYYYVDPIPDSARSAQSIEELLALLGDPYTDYMPEEVLTSFLNSINGSTYVGVGITVEEHEHGVLITSVLDNSPAQEAGLAVGDVILTADGIPLVGIEHAQSLLRGEAGTSVSATVRKADGSTVTVLLARREVLVPVTTSGFLTEDGAACVIQCDSFGDTTSDEFADLLDEYNDKINCWIIDLSGNIGGTSQSAAAAAGCFVGSGTMLYLRDGGDSYSYTYVLPGTPARTNKPAILLTGPGTASAAELFTAALRDHDGGISMGQRTYGKGVAQVMLDESRFPEIFHGDALKVTAYRFFSPDGVTNDQIGVFPTLLTDLDKTYAASLLLSGAEPAQPDGHLSVALSDRVFYVDLKTAVSEDYRPAFVELLEALPPYAVLQIGSGKLWQATDAADTAKRLGLTEYQKRSFNDLANCSQKEAIETLCTYGLVSGDGSGAFRPDATLTRAEFCAMLGNLLWRELSAVKETSFTDVDPGAWYAPVIQAMRSSGLLAGYGDGTFRPDAPITQEEAITILASVATRLNMIAYDTRKTAIWQPSDLEKYQQCSTWAREPAWLLTTLNVDLTGLAPQTSATRALAADLLCQLLTQTGVLWK